MSGTPTEKEMLTLEKAINPLGYSGEKYYYFSKLQGQILILRPQQHTSKNLFRIQPLCWWEANFPDSRSRVHWALAASTLMEMCRAKGYYTNNKMRGRSDERMIGNTSSDRGGSEA